MAWPTETELETLVARFGNDSHGTPNSDTRGYHETITRAYVLLIAECPPDSTTAECVGQLLATRLAQRDALLAYYLKDRLMSVAARRGAVEPDRRALAGADPIEADPGFLETAIGDGSSSARRGPKSAR